MLDVRRLRLLRELQLRGTLTEVASALSYSPSLISQQLAILEREAGAPLLRKVGRRVQLTPHGEFLATRAAEILDALERTEADLAAIGGRITGVIRIAVFQSVAHSLIPRMLTTIHRDHPDLRVELVEREPEVGLFETIARDFDLVIAEEYPRTRRAQHPALDRVSLGSDELLIGFGPRTTISEPADLSRYPWVAEPRGTASREWLIQMCRAAGFEPDVRFETPDLVTHVRLSEAGQAICVVPNLLLTSLAGPLIVRPLFPPEQRELFTSTRVATASAPAIIAVRAALADAYAALSA